MVYLKKDKQSVMHELGELWKAGNRFLARAPSSTDNPRAFAEEFSKWFDTCAESVRELVDVGSVTMALDIAHFPHRWSLYDDGREADGPGRRLQLWRHVREPLEALAKVVAAVEASPEDSDALAEVREHLEEFHVAVLKRLAEMQSMQQSNTRELKQLAHWTYDQVEHLYLAVVREELKPEFRRVLERHGPRVLVLAARSVA